MHIIYVCLVAYIVDLITICNHLQEIKADHKEVNQCFTAMLQCWLSQTSPPPTWATLIEALNSTVIGRQDIANNIGPDLRGHFESTDKSSVDQQLGVDDLKQIRSATFALRVHWFDLGVELDVTLAKLQVSFSKYMQLL